MSVDPTALYIHGKSKRVPAYMFITREGWEIFPLYKLDDYGETVESILDQMIAAGRRVYSIVVMRDPQTRCVWDDFLDILPPR